MPFSGWTTAENVRYRGKQFVDAEGWGDTRVEVCITRAMDHLRGFFTSLFGDTIVGGWTSTSDTPPLVQQLCADQAIVFINQDAFGEAQLQTDKPGGLFKEQLEKNLELIRKGTLAVVDSSGKVIEKYRSRVGSTTIAKEPTFSLRNQVLKPRKKSILSDW